MAEIKLNFRDKAQSFTIKDLDLVEEYVSHGLMGIAICRREIARSGDYADYKTAYDQFPTVYLAGGFAGLAELPFWRKGFVFEKIRYIPEMYACLNREEIKIYEEIIGKVGAVIIRD